MAHQIAGLEQDAPDYRALAALLVELLDPAPVLVKRLEQLSHPRLPGRIEQALQLRHETLSELLGRRAAGTAGRDGVEWWCALGGCLGVI